MLIFLFTLFFIFIFYKKTSITLNNIESFNDISNELYTDKSSIQGNGLFTKKNLNKGDSIGLLSTIISKNKFIDSNGHYINHSNNNNVDLNIKVDNNKIYVYGHANKYIVKNTELTANYNHIYAPKPNFINNDMFDYDKIINNK